MSRIAPTPAAGPERLLFEQGLGGFTESGDEYVLRLRRDESGRHLLPPRPWINVIANERFGFLVSETGAGYTWSGNSREHRLTPWANDPLVDPHDEALYLRDEATGHYWSPLPGPAPAPADYEVRHGFGVTRFLVDAEGLEQETTLLVARHDPVKIVRLRISNQGKTRRALRACWYARLVLGVHAEETAPFVSVEASADGRTLFAINPQADAFAGAVVFSSVHATSAAAGDATSWTGDRASFLGPDGEMARPCALAGPAPLNRRDGRTGDPCFAWAVGIELAPGASTEICFLFGEGRERSEAEDLARRYATAEAAAQAEAEARGFWQKHLSRLRIETPDRGLDVMMNGWLAYQVLVCRLWARSALYQSGGAFGFRDQLQDAAAWLYLQPELTREQILLHAAHQFVEGDVLHWWHPPQSRGIRTRFADDLLWLPLITAFYVGATGDHGLLRERVRYLRAPQLEPGEDEVFLQPEDSGESGELYDHCCRAIDRSLPVGAHGLPLFGTGDWNDGMNRVGREGRGESVWMAFFLGLVLESFAPICEERGESDRARRYREWHRRMVAAVNDAGWDGEWYRRGFYDDGEPLGSAASDECRIDALVQAWAVLSRMAPPARARQAVEAMERRLFSEAGRIVRLLDPPLQHTPKDPGYIKGYAPGVRENGGQYTHAALWVVRAEAELERREVAWKLLEWMNPVHRTRTPGEIETYRLEPYVVAADIYGVPPHLGRGGWSWYTGSAGWMYRVTLESLLGLTIEEGRTLCLRPRLPDAWSDCTIHFTWAVAGRDATYEIHLVNPTGTADRVVSASIDGEIASVENGVARFGLAGDGGFHQLRVVLGPF